MNFLITGGAGYIGSHGALAFIDKGHKVTVVDSLINGSKKLIPKKCEFIISDIANEKKISKILKKKKFDAIIHYAALTSVPESIKYPSKYYKYNFLKSKKFINICLKHGLGKIVYSSTAGVYGNKLRKIKETHSLKPQSPYAKSKLKFENYLKNLNKKKRVDYTILRYFNVAGADKFLRSGLLYNKGNLIKTLCEVATKKRKKITIFGKNYNTKDGTTIRDYIHVNDLSSMHVAAAENLVRNNNFKSDVFNCGYGSGYTTKQVLDSMKTILKGKINYEFGSRRKRDIEYSVASSKKFNKKFNWKPKFNDLKIILKSALAWEKKMSRINFRKNR